MVFFFTRYLEGDDHGWIYFDRPRYLARRQYQQVSMDKVTILDNEGSWFGAFYYRTNGADQRWLYNTLVFFGTGPQVWARMRRQFQGVAKSYHVKPLKVIQAENVIRLVKCRYCKGEGKTIPALYDLDPECLVCVGTCVEEEERV